jgi:hypothetical protein
MERLRLSNDEQIKFADRAFTLRFPDPATTGTAPSQPLACRGPEDAGDDLWSALNKVQLCRALHNCNMLRCRLCGEHCCSTARFAFCGRRLHITWGRFRGRVSGAGRFPRYSWQRSAKCPEQPPANVRFREAQHRARPRTGSPRVRIKEASIPASAHGCHPRRAQRAICSSSTAIPGDTRCASDTSSCRRTARRMRHSAVVRRGQALQRSLHA